VPEAWVAAGWLMPTAQEEQQFLEIDLARAQLIQDLKNDIGVNDECIAVTLPLIDQVHGLRRTLGSLLSAIRAQPQGARKQLVVDLHLAMMG
jgi:chaperone modulatory protein CbpM